jgi:hypothetical protein
MEDIWSRIAEDMIDRVSGPMKFRLLLQPTVAAIFAIRSGLKDARSGKPPCLWTLATDPMARAELIEDGWQSVGKVFMFALALESYTRSWSCTSCIRARRSSSRSCLRSCRISFCEGS